MRRATTTRGNAKYTFNAFANGVTPYISGEAGYWDIGTSDSFYGCTAGCLTIAPLGINYKNYTHWNVGVGWSYKVLTG